MYLRGRFNPEPPYEKDICIYILGSTPDSRFSPEYVYHDVVDCGLRRMRRIKRMKGDIIAVSKTQYPILQEFYRGRKVFLIPQHHCNFKREKRPERPVLRVGTIGGDSAIQWPHYSMTRMLKREGLEFVFGYQYHKRQMVVDFYKNLDIQIVFRPTHSRDLMMHLSPLKLANAGSFGIPTVAWPEPGYVAEWKDECLWGTNIYEIIDQVKRLRDDPKLYQEMANRAVVKAEEYHIDNIMRLYKDLPGVKS
jgi:glycosyltransferase involved in cell wall biosynthesis